MSQPPKINPLPEFLYHYKAVVIDLYDADTLTLDIDLGLGAWRRGEKVRLARVDAPELRGEERTAGLVARDYVRGMLLGKEVIIRTIKDRSGKYGRYIAEIQYGEINLSDHLVKEGHAEYKNY